MKYVKLGLLSMAAAALVACGQSSGPAVSTTPTNASPSASTPAAQKWLDQSAQLR